MPNEVKVPVTQRAYTLRLQGADANDPSWREALWRSHEAVNKGAQAFGDWLLTLRGGLDHNLAGEKIKAGKGKAEREPTEEERKERRILLALSWLSVESKLGAPEKFIIASGQDAAGDRNARVIAALVEILRSRGVAEDEIQEWERDCSASLCAAIREDAVWVNRSKAFDEALKSSGSSLSRKEVWDMLERFLGESEAYFAPAKTSEKGSSEAESEGEAEDSSEEEPKEQDKGQQEEKAKDLVQKAGQWLSSRFGTGKGADFARMAEIYEKIGQWAKEHPSGQTGPDAIASLATALYTCNPPSQDLQGVLKLISGPGYKSATRNLLTRIAHQATVTDDDLEKLQKTAKEDIRKCESNTGSKGGRAYADAILKEVESVCGFTYLTDKNGNDVSVAKRSDYPDDYPWGPARHHEFAVMLDHAARRVSMAHSWIKRAEAERRQFEKDVKKIENVPESVRVWLDKFCSERSVAEGALEPYRIRRRAVDGWKEVVAEWSKAHCKTEEDRIAAARALQDDPEIKKFGDIRLFEELAKDDALCVWHKDGDPAKAPDPQPLINYVLAFEAEFKKRHFKVPAYRHPDALLHPVFCDFGTSRWKIKFAVHEAQKKEGRKGKDMARQSDARGLTMTLWTGREMKEVPLHWQSKRFSRDLALGQNPRDGEVSEVSRADRLGRAAANVTDSREIRIAGLFEEKEWNGRLQAPRRQLEAIAAVRDNPNLSIPERERRMSAMRDRIRWLVSFSARLQPQGPWCAFAEKNQLKINPRYWPHADANKRRKGKAKLILCRLPGLRVLSVDLGHRYAAACAVWEAVSSQQVRTACQEAGHREPEAGDLYLHLKKKVRKQKKGGQVEAEQTTIYRRIGGDTLPDGTPHPAPWARLDRQFLIKLQGEEEGAREASTEEIWAVHQMEASLGRSLPLIHRLYAAGWGSTEKQKARLEKLKKLGWIPMPKAQVSGEGEEGEETDAYSPSVAVDELMFSAVRSMRLGLVRHGNQARIAFAMTADYKPMPGDRKYYFTEAKELSENDDQDTRRQKHVEFIQDALKLWQELAISRVWRDEAAKKLWDEHLGHLPGYTPIEEIALEAATGVSRKERQKMNEERLHAMAEKLVADEDLRKTLHDVWKTRWENDEEWWKSQLRWFKDWILPRGKAANDPAIRKVGGLSLTRLATISEFRRRVQLGFFTRLRPDGSKAQSKEGFGQKALDALEHLREQRVKQLASRIVEAALGLGRMRREKGGKDPKRPDVRKDKPCHAIVIENLTRYRPEETRTRRENRQLMQWSSSRVKKYLDEACQLYGLHFREVSASYTSRQDSRTGAPGIRCQDVSVREFIHSPFWRKQVAQAKRKRDKGKGSARDRFLCDLNERWKDKPEAQGEEAGVIRVPLRGGEVFVSADPASPAARGLQADLNAAANIGLRALTDPDWPGKWWYVPCEPGSLIPKKDEVEGSAAVNRDQPLRQPVQRQSGDEGEKELLKKGTGKETKAVNLWRDISSSPLGDTQAGEWEDSTAYWNKVQWRVIDILKEQKHWRGR